MFTWDRGTVSMAQSSHLREPCLLDVMGDACVLDEEKMGMMRDLCLIVKTLLGVFI